MVNPIIFGVSLSRLDTRVAKSRSYLWDSPRLGHRVFLDRNEKVYRGPWVCLIFNSLKVIEMSFQGARSCSSCIVKLIVLIIVMFGIKHLLLHHHKNRGHKSHKVSKIQRITKTSTDKSSITINASNNDLSKYIKVWF